MIVRVGQRRRYTQIENTPIEDDRLSFRALGMLTFLLSKPDNWQADYRHLATTHTEGERAVLAALKELEQAGYFDRVRQRNSETGRWEWVQVIHECPECEQFEPQEQSLGEVVTMARKARHGPTSENTTKEQDPPCRDNRAADIHAAETRGAESAVGTSTREQQPRATTESKNNTALADARTAAVVDHFDTFWSVYPLKAAKEAARKAFVKAARKVPVQTILDGACRYRDDPNRVAQFTKHPATWLNGGCWDDEPLKPRHSGGKRDPNAGVNQIVRRFESKYGGEDR